MSVAVDPATAEVATRPHRRAPATPEPRGTEHLSRTGARAPRAVALAIGSGAALLSILPSLLPRTWPAQAVLTGLCSLLGYLAALPLDVVVRRWAPSAAVLEHVSRRWGTIALLGVLLPASVLMTAAGLHWHVEQRALLGMDAARPVELAALAAAGYAGALAALALRQAAAALLAVLLRAPTAAARAGWARRVVPLVIVPMIWLAVGQAAVPAANAALDGHFRAVADTSDPDRTAPVQPERSGSPESLVEWGDLGREGQRFVTRGPETAQIEAFLAARTDRAGRAAGPVPEPIRVYGPESDLPGTSAVQMLVAELERTSAGERAAILVVVPTGTGWVDPDLAAAFELMHGGDTAIASMAYSDRPSWMVYLTEPDAAALAAHEMTTAVHAWWSSLPATDRPELFLAGVSLGSFGAQGGWQDVEQLTATFSGAIFAGTPNATALWRSVTEGRDVGSPEVAPSLPASTGVRFSDGAPGALTPGAADVVYVQHGTDAVTWWSPELAWRRPDWLAERRAADVLGATTWIPGITFLQVTTDLLLSGSSELPTGTAHTYGAAYVDALAAVTAPAGWTPADSDDLRLLVGTGGDR